MKRSIAADCLRVLVLGLLALPSGISLAESLPSTVLSSQYLLIGRNVYSGNADAATNDFELGANKAPVPSTDKFLSDKVGGPLGTGGPTLISSQPAIPANAKPVFEGIGGQGNIAVTDPKGELHLQDVGVYADPAIGIRLAAPEQSYNKSSNSFFNDPNKYPNTYDPVTKTGTKVYASPDSDPQTLNAVQTTRIDPTTNGGYNAGITFGFDHAPLLAELELARTAINALAQTGTLTTNAGKIEYTNRTVTVGSGLSVIDILTSGNDFLLNTANLVIDGPADATVIFRLPGTANMNVANSNILIGNSGIGFGSVLFYTDQGGTSQNDTHFSFNNTILSGVAFWSLAPGGGEITVNNGQGCTQFVADKITLNDVRFNRCAFDPYVPPPQQQQLVPAPSGLIGLLSMGLTAVFFAAARYWNGRTARPRCGD